jgi:hypothetical protein
LIRETALFKVELDLAEELQRRLEYLEWHAKVVRLDRHSDIEMGNEGGELPPSDFQIEKLQSLMQEGQAKGFS